MFPFIRISDELMIPTYMLVLSLTYCAALVFAFFRADAKSNIDSDPSNPSQADFSKRNTALDLALAIMIGGFLGARFFHVAYELPEFYWQNPSEIFKFWRGGFVYYGGFLGALLCCVLYLRWRKLSFLEWGDFYAPVLSLGYALGRIGCFLNGCCYGELCELPWAVEFTYPGLPLGLRHPTQLYATFYELMIFVFLLALERRKKSLSLGALKTGQLFFIWLILHAGGRILMEIWRGDDRGSYLAGLSISTWISLVLIVIGLTWLQKSRAKNV